MARVETPEVDRPRTPRKEFGRKVLAHQRYYTSSGELVPGVTTILSELAKPQLVPWANRLGLQGIDARKYTDEAAQVGSLAHYLIECMMRGSEPELGDFTPAQVEMAQQSVAAFKDWLNQHEMEPYLVEQQLVSDEHRFGGTVDWYGMLDGVPTLVDFKTSSGIYDEHKFQVGGYWKLLQERGKPVKGIRIVRIYAGVEEHRLSGLETLRAWHVFEAALAVYYRRREFRGKGGRARA